ncbi:MAG TPA: hypothetical protein VK716_08190 [Terracidiphilus sp.]|jgi:hypothetical protein|nr:hypothetical protein [Terracidiphilus sp.]
MSRIRISNSAFRVFLAVALFGSVRVVAQDIPIGATYVCSGEHIYIENCNIRDTSDTSTCMVAHPDHLTPSGMNTYTYATRGALKKLLPTCQQPSAKQLGAANAFQKKQQDTYNANAQKASDQLDQNLRANAQADATRAQSLNTSQIQPPKNAEEHQIRRCVSSGRLPASCTGNSLLGWFSQALGSVAPGLDKQTQAEAGPNMAGVFQGADNWRLDFIDGGVLVNCSTLSPNQESYSLKFEPNRTSLVIDIKPRPLVLTFHPDGSITGPGPVTIDGVFAAGYVSGAAGTGATQQDQYGNLYDAGGNRVQGNVNNGHTNFAPRRVTCPALNLTSKGAGTGIQTMQTDLLKTMFGGDKGAPTPPGIRMHGIFAASTGFSLQFFPESVILGCGPDSARAYPYTVVAGGAGAVIKIDAPDHPLNFSVRPDGSLDPGNNGSYQVHGRMVTGQDDNDDFTFAPLEASCNLAVLAPSKTIPASGATSAAAGSASSTAGSASGGTLSTPQAPLGNAVLTIASGFPAQPGIANPLAGRPYILLRSSYADSLAQGGVAVPAGTSPFKYAGAACAAHSPDCQKISLAIHLSAASAARADGSGNASLPGLPPGTYYLMISAVDKNQPYVWGQAVQLHAGQNSITLDLRNATPLH